MRYNALYLACLIGFQMTIAQTEAVEELEDYYEFHGIETGHSPDMDEIIEQDYARAKARANEEILALVRYSA